MPFESFSGLGLEPARTFASSWLPAWTGNRPEELLAFYAHDAFYSDPAVPDGLLGHEQIRPYFERLLNQFPGWVWKQERATPLDQGFLNYWRADIPTPGGDTLTCRGVCTVRLRDGLICRNEVFFDRSELVAALQR
jgi:hypothetical protein